MRRALAITALALAPLTAAAQEDAWVDAPYIRACFAGTPTGQTAPECLRAAADACSGKPGWSTTLGISQCLQAETAVWDALLNEQYQARMAALANLDAGLPDQLRTAQRAWIAFRDADCGLAYAIWLDGSMRTVAAASCHLKKTAERALELRDLEGL